MRIYAGWAAGVFQAGQMNPAVNQKHAGSAPQQGAAIRKDTAVISPQGKSSNVLANLMNQKELIQMNKESLIQRSLDEENGTAGSGLKEQLEEYEKKLEELDRQIAAEMTKRSEDEQEHNLKQENPYGKRQDEGVLESTDKSMIRLTELSADSDRAQTAVQVQNRRDGEKRVYESEMEMGSAAAEHKLEKLEKLEQLTDELKPVLERFRL